MVIDWIKDYLSERTQFVDNNGYYSSCCISRGVPQGSILGPLFYALYINDIPYVSDLFDVILFADDTNLFFSHNDPAYLFHTINRELDRLSDWFKCNKLSLKIKKSKFFLFRPRQKRPALDICIKKNNFSRTSK